MPDEQTSLPPTDQVSQPGPVPVPSQATVISPTVVPAQPAVTPAAPFSPQQNNPQPQVYSAPIQASPSPAPSYQQQPVMTPGSYSQATSGMGAPKGRLRLLPIGLGAGAIVLVVVGLLAYSVYGSSISLSDVHTAQQSTDTLSADIADLSDAELNISSATSASNASSQATLANTKLADAAKQVSLLKNSKIQHDASTKKAFDAFNAKWPAYYTYIKGDTADAQALMPVILDFVDQMDQLSANAPTDTASMATYLTTFKSDVDTTSQKISSLHMQTTENKELVQAFQVFLQATSTDVAQAQNDLSTSGYSYKLINDLSSVDDAQTSFDQTQQTVSDQINAQLKQIDPSDQFTAFSEALGNLSVKTAAKS